MIRRANVLAPLLVLGACTTPDSGISNSQNDAESFCRNLSAAVLGVGSVSSKLSAGSDQIGGLSGIEFDPKSQHYLLVSDDRGPNGGARLYTASLVLLGGKVPDLHIDKATTLTVYGPEGQHDIRPAVDVESIRLTPSGALIWSSEGVEAAGVPPEVVRRLHGQPNGRTLPLPRILTPDPERGTGPRPNRSFEGLATGLLPGRYFVALEAPLAETDAMPTLASGGLAPIFELDFNGRIHSQYSYPLEPIATQLPGRLADNGISEILAPASGSFLVLERSGSQQEDGSFRFVARLFCAWPSAQSRAPGDLVPLQKRLIIDFSKAGVTAHANLEGMTFGPERPDGSTELLMISDNNFRADRPSHVILVSLRLFGRD
jgi:hypothetical protein